MSLGTTPGASSPETPSLWDDLLTPDPDTSSERSSNPKTSKARCAHDDVGSFIKLFEELTGYRHRREVFTDFVTMSAIAIHNAIRPTPKLEEEYLQIVGRYEEKDRQVFPKLLGELVMLLEFEPRDVLGQLFMSLELGNEKTGQHFTPPEVSLLMSKMLYGDAIATEIEKREEGDRFVTLCEPACGAGGMVLAFAKSVIDAGYNPGEVMWARCQDVDRSVALMCYLQLSLWNVPAVVVVGNSLADEIREAFFTPAHYLRFWDTKIASRQRRLAEKVPVESTFDEPKSDEVTVAWSVQTAPTDAQTSFDFEIPPRQAER